MELPSIEKPGLNQLTILRHVVKLLAEHGINVKLLKASQQAIRS
jgi:hypothetical protein